MAKINAVLIAIVFTSLLSGCGGDPVPAAQPVIARSGVLFYGDSIFGNWHLDDYFPGKGYVNGGYFGQRTDQLLARLPDALSGANVCSGFDGGGDPSQSTLKCGPIPPPATIVILAGWNNMFQANLKDPSNMLPDIQQMAAMARAQGVRVIVCTVYAYDPGHPAPWMVPTGTAPVDSYDLWRDPLNAGIVKTPGVTIVDMSSMFAGQIDYTADGVHPIASGYSQMHDLIASVAKL